MIFQKSKVTQGSVAMPVLQYVHLVAMPTCISKIIRSHSVLQYIWISDLKFYTV